MLKSKEIEVEMYPKNGTALQISSVADHLITKHMKKNVHLTNLPVPSTCPLHTNSGCGKERRMFIGLW